MSYNQLKMPKAVFAQRQPVAAAISQPVAAAISQQSAAAISQQSAAAVILFAKHLPENNNSSLCRREPAVKAGKSGFNKTKSKSVHSSSGRSRHPKFGRRARSITRKRLLRQLLIMHTLLRVIYIKKQLREIERKRKYDYYRNLKRDRRKLFFMLARMQKSEKEAQNQTANKPSRTVRLFNVFSALEKRELAKSEQNFYRPAA